VRVRSDVEDLPRFSKGRVTALRAFSKLQPAQLLSAKVFGALSQKNTHRTAPHSRTSKLLKLAVRVIAERAVLSSRRNVITRRAIQYREKRRALERRALPVRLPGRTLYNRERFHGGFGRRLFVGRKQPITVRGKQSVYLPPRVI
jgi:hypothetical protein